MFTPAVIFLMIANTLAASGAIFAAWQISSLEVGRKRQLTDVKSLGNNAREAVLVEDRALRKAA